MLEDENRKTLRPIVQPPEKRTQSANTKKESHVAATPERQKSSDTDPILYYR